LIRRPAGVPDDSEDDRAARRLEEFLRAREPQDEGAGDEDEAAETDGKTAEKDGDGSAQETDDSEAAPEPKATPEPAEDRQTKP
jgi:hypothetical protein